VIELVNNNKTKNKKPIDFKYNLKQYWNIAKNYKFLGATILLATILIEISLLVDKFILKEVIDKATEFVSGNLAVADFTSSLWLYFFIFLGVLIIRPILKWTSLHLLFAFSTNTIFDLKKKMLSHLIRLSYNFHTTNKTGSIISRLIRGGWAIDSMSDILVYNLAPLIIQTILVGVSVMVFDFASSMVVFGVIIVFVYFSFRVNRWQEKANMKANNQEDYEKGIIADIFTNIDSIKYFGKEKQIERKYNRIGRKTSDIFRWHWNHFRVLSAGHTAILMIGTLLLMLFPILKLIKGEMSVGDLVFIYAVFGNLIHPLFSFDHGLRQFYKAMADFESLFTYQKIENEIKDAPKAKNLEIERGKIEFKDVSFKYKKRYVLKKFNLVIPKNKNVAFVGSSGAGKSTIVRLLYRLFDLTDGQILIDDININDVKQESLRGALSIVPQECILFDDTLYNNIAFSNKKASRKDVLKAMKFAQLDKTIKELPEKENTIVGERGVKLSGGEKQRVSIARAILADKKILVLDEATSALDSETEHEIQRDLERLMKGRTSIIIAHRLSTIMRADVIVVLDRGKIAQIGTHRELIRKEGIYKKLWNLQKGGYIK